MRTIITDRLHPKMLPYTEGTIKIYRASITDIKRALVNGAEAYIYNDDNREWLEEFLGTRIENKTEPLLLTRDEKTVIYVITKHGEHIHRLVWRMVYTPEGIECR